MNAEVSRIPDDAVKPNAPPEGEGPRVITVHHSRRRPKPTKSSRNPESDQGNGSRTTPGTHRRRSSCKPLIIPGSAAPDDSTPSGENTGDPFDRSFDTMRRHSRTASQQSYVSLKFTEPSTRRGSIASPQPPSGASERQGSEKLNASNTASRLSSASRSKQDFTEFSF